MKQSIIVVVAARQLNDRAIGQVVGPYGGGMQQAAIKVVRLLAISFKNTME